MAIFGITTQTKRIRDQLARESGVALVRDGEVVADIMIKIS